MLKLSERFQPTSPTPRLLLLGAGQRRSLILKSANSCACDATSEDLRLAHFLDEASAVAFSPQRLFIHRFALLLRNLFRRPKKLSRGLIKDLLLGSWPRLGSWGFGHTLSYTRSQEMPNPGAGVEKLRVTRHRPVLSTTQLLNLSTSLCPLRTISEKEWR